MAPPARSKPSGLRLVFFIFLCLGGVYWIHYDSPERIDVIKLDPETKARLCHGRFVYMYDLPVKFNKEIVEQCHKSDNGEGVCESLGHWGLGTPYPSEVKPFSDYRHWWKTNAFSAEIQFHHRFQTYKCLTDDPEQANLFYVPFYPGLELALVTATNAQRDNDALSLELIEWLKGQKTFLRREGRDHFLVTGRTSHWLRRPLEQKDQWGSALEHFPEVKKMLKLQVERFAYSDKTHIGIPYPTAFHPISSKQLRRWQASVRRLSRPIKFATITPPVAYEEESTLQTRKALLKQCLETSACEHLNCSAGCDSTQVMSLLLRSQYYVQDGSSNAHCHIFDAILAGAIPVVLFEGTFLSYEGVFPADSDSFSVTLPHEDVPEWTKVEARLGRISNARYIRMRNSVVSLISRIVYRDPEHRIAGEKDAFDHAIDTLFERTNPNSTAETVSSEGK